MNEIEQRAGLAGTKARSIHIYNGHVKEDKARPVLILSIQRNDDGTWPTDKLQYAKNLRGDYTGVILPSREYFYLSSSQANQHFFDFENNNLASMNGGVVHENLKELVDRILNLERENTALKTEREELKKELSRFETGADKFSYALEQLFYKVAPKFGLNIPVETTLQGTRNNDNMNWQTVDLSGNDDDTTEAALGVLLMAFGDDTLRQFARKVQNNPNLVNQLKVMI